MLSSGRSINIYSKIERSWRNGIRWEKKCQNSTCSTGLIQKKLCLSFLKKYSFIYPAAVGLRCGPRALSLWPTDSLAAGCGVSCSVARGPLVPWPGIKTKSPASQGRFLTTGPPEKFQKKLHFLVGKKWFYISNFVWFNLKQSHIGQKQSKTIDIYMCVCVCVYIYIYIIMYTYTHLNM